VSPKRSLSYRGSRKRHHSGSESDDKLEKQLSRQRSLHKEESTTTKSDAEKKQEEWDKDIPEVCVHTCNGSFVYNMR
jgi:hypothetical protein